MYVATKGPNVKWGALISNEGSGYHWPPAGDGPAFTSKGNHSMGQHKRFEG